MTIDPQMSLGSLVRAHPQIIPLFDTWGLDYCCGGRASFAAASGTLGLSLETALPLLEQAAAQTWHAPAGHIESSTMNLQELADAIEKTHHVYTRQALSGLEPLVEKVRRVHGEIHPELLEIQSLFQALVADLTPHLIKEEQVLFPMLRRMAGAKSWDEVDDGPGPNSTEGPINCMHREHDAVGAILQRLSVITNNYQVPQGGCSSYQRLFADLKALEQDLHQHIHLENNVLFPNAWELEKKLRS